MTTITIVLAVMLLAAALIAGASLHLYRCIEPSYKAQCKRIEIFKAALDDTYATYCIKYLKDGKLAVVRVSNALNCINQSVIKVFDDEDVQFNILCAEELCEHLNEK